MTVQSYRMTAGEMGQRRKVMATQAECTEFSVPGTHEKVEGGSQIQSCPLTSTQVPLPMRTHNNNTLEK